MLPQFDGIDNRHVLLDGSVAWDNGNDEYRSRFGFDTMTKVVQKLCKLVSSQATRWREYFADNQFILFCLDLTQVLCEFVPLMTIPMSGGNVPPNGDALLGQAITALENLIAQYGGTE